MAVQVINGISIGLVAPASIGIPLIHRDWTQGAGFTTGHSKTPDVTPDANPDWQTLAKLNLALVTYMGLARCAKIQAALLTSGKSAAMPVAVIQSATGKAQAQLITTLATLP